MLNEKQIDAINQIIRHPEFINSISKLSSIRELNPNYLFEIISNTVLYMTEDLIFTVIELETDENKAEIYKLLLPYCEQLINPVSDDNPNNIVWTNSIENFKNNLIRSEDRKQNKKYWNKSLMNISSKLVQRNRLWETDTGNRNQGGTVSSWDVNDRDVPTDIKIRVANLSNINILEFRVYDNSRYFAINSKHDLIFYPADIRAVGRHFSAKADEFKEIYPAVRMCLELFTKKDTPSEENFFLVDKDNNILLENLNNEYFNCINKLKGQGDEMPILTEKMLQEMIEEDENPKLNTSEAIKRLNNDLTFEDGIGDSAWNTIKTDRLNEDYNITTAYQDGILYSNLLNEAGSLILNIKDSNLPIEKRIEAFRKRKEVVKELREVLRRNGKELSDDFIG